MRKLTLAILAAAAGAAAGGAAMYFLDPELGQRRRGALPGQLKQWGTTARDQALQGTHGLRDRAAGLRDRAAETWAQSRDWVRSHLGRADGDAVANQADGLEPLSMTPPPLEQAGHHRSRLLPALALAAPVAVAVGAAVLKRRDDGAWLH